MGLQFDYLYYPLGPTMMSEAQNGDNKAVIRSPRLTYHEENQHLWLIQVLFKG